jgi:3D (Asp-Asp-Asp) domain-containing protein
MKRLIQGAALLITAAAVITTITVYATESEQTSEPSKVRASVGVSRYSAPTILETETETTAVTEFVEETTAPMTEAVTETVTETEPTSLGTFKLTAYCPCPKCCGEWADGVTYTGTEATAGRTIAVDPTVIPLGTTVHINGQAYTAEDIGGAITGNRIDVYFPTHTEALQFGVQYAEVAIN